MPYVTPTQQARTKLVEKFAKSLYTDLNSSACKSDNLPIIFEVKHTFVCYNDFEVDLELVDSFEKWITDRL